MALSPPPSPPPPPPVHTNSESLWSPWCEGAALVHLLRARAVAGDHTSKKTTPSSPTVYDALEPPPISISDYIARWLAYAHADLTKLVIATIYIKRFLDTKIAKLTSYNVHRVLFIALIVAAKFHDDSPFANSHYAVVGGMSVREIARLEIQFLLDLNFDLAITSDDLNTEMLWLRAQQERHSQQLAAKRVESPLSPAELPICKAEEQLNRTKIVGNTAARSASESPHLVSGQCSKLRLAAMTPPAELVCRTSSSEDGLSSSDSPSATWSGSRLTGSNSGSEASPSRFRYRSMSAPPSPMTPTDLDCTTVRFVPLDAQ